MCCCLKLDESSVNQKLRMRQDLSFQTRPQSIAIDSKNYKLSHSIGNTRTIEKLEQMLRENLNQLSKRVILNSHYFSTVVYNGKFLFIVLFQKI